MKVVRNRLRVLRADRVKPISQIDIAHKAKLSHTRYWRIEKGYALPTDSERERLAKILGVTVEEAFPAERKRPSVSTAEPSSNLKAVEAASDADTHTARMA
jgi:transcriptional regulator with XRE-family HTH domain